MKFLKHVRYEVLRLLLCRYTNGFDTYEDFARHFHKHAHKVGITTDWRYLRRADTMFRPGAVPANHHGNPSNDLEECVRKRDLSTLRYYNPANEIAIRHGRYIGTCFGDVRKNLRTYFLAECV